MKKVMESNGHTININVIGKGEIPVIDVVKTINTSNGGFKMINGKVFRKIRIRTLENGSKEFTLMDANNWGWLPCRYILGKQFDITTMIDSVISDGKLLKNHRLDDVTIESDGSLRLLFDIDETESTCDRILIQKYFDDTDNYCIAEYKFNHDKKKWFVFENQFTNEFECIDKFETLIDSLRDSIGKENTYKILSYLRNDGIELAGIYPMFSDSELYINIQKDKDGIVKYCNYMVNPNSVDRWQTCRKILGKQYDESTGFRELLKKGAEIPVGHIINSFSIDFYRKDKTETAQVYLLIDERSPIKEKVCDALYIEFNNSDSTHKSLCEFRVDEDGWIGFLNPYTIDHRIYETSAELIHALKKVLGDTNLGSSPLVHELCLHDVYLF